MLLVCILHTRYLPSADTFGILQPFLRMRLGENRLFRPCLIPCYRFTEKLWCFNALEKGLEI